MPVPRLKLVAMDEDDLKIVSAYCQDGVLKVGDLRFLVKENRFILEINRFVWEGAGKKRSIPERRRTVLHFEKVQAVSSMGIDLGAKEAVLAILAVRFIPEDVPHGVIELVFSGNSIIRLDVECIEAQLADMKVAWAASSTPKHPLDTKTD